MFLSAFSLTDLIPPLTWELWYGGFLLLLLFMRVFGIGWIPEKDWKVLDRPSSTTGFRRKLFYRHDTGGIVRGIFARVFESQQARRPIEEYVLEFNAKLIKEWLQRCRGADYRILRTVPVLCAIGWSQTASKDGRRILFGLEQWLIHFWESKFRDLISPYVIGTAGHELVHGAQQVATEGPEKHGVLEREWQCEGRKKLSKREWKSIEQQAHDLFPVPRRWTFVAGIVVASPYFITIAWRFWDSRLYWKLPWQ